MKTQALFLSQDSPSVFETRDVVQLTGIPLVVLNKFIEHKSFGLAPSVRTGKGRGSRRLFGTHDLLGIALVWWLYRSGLQSRVIDEVLKDIFPWPNSFAGISALASSAAAIVVTNLKKSDKPLFIVIDRPIETGKKRMKKAPRQARLARKSEVQPFSESSSVHLVPVESLMWRLIEETKRFRPGWNL